MRYFDGLTVTPETMLAGDSYEISMTTTAVSDFDVSSSSLILDLPATLGFTRPSLYDQEDNGYVAVFCSNPNIVYKKYVWDMESEHYAGQGKDSFRGMAQRMIVVQFESGKMNSGDTLQVIWGYTRGGFGVGTKVSTIVPLPDFRLDIDMRYFTRTTPAFPDYGRNFEGYQRPVPDEHHCAKIRILPREPSTIRVLRKKNKTCVILYDRFYNACTVSDLHDYVEFSGTAKPNGHSVYEISDPDVEVISKGLPLTEAPRMENAWGEYTVYFGDLHSHSSVSNDCTEREKMPLNARACMQFAKEAACLDFYAVTDHHQPWDEQRNRIQASNWQDMLDAVQDLRSEDFVPFAGFEFRSPRGDTAVVFRDMPPYEAVNQEALTEVDLLWKGLTQYDMITIPHFHLLGELKPNVWIHEESGHIEPVIEIYSCHGSFETPDAMERGTPISKKRRPDRNAEYLLKKGYQYGLVCNSDGHKGNPGTNGLTAILAKELTPESIFEALRARRVYGTTNARIRMVFAMNGELMGSELHTPKKNIEIRLCGENQWKVVRVIYNGEVVRQYCPTTKECVLTDQLDDCGDGYFYVKAIQVDNHIVYSSPIWVKSEK